MITELARLLDLPLLQGNAHHGQYQHIARMRIITEISKEAMDELSAVHYYAEHKLVETLNEAEHIRRELEAAVQPSQEATYTVRTQAYVARMQQIAEDAGNKLVFMADRVPL